MHTFTKTVFICPYYQADNRDGGVACECGKIKFGSKKYARLYWGMYCANNPGWEECSLAKHMTRRLLDEDEKKRTE